MIILRLSCKRAHSLTMYRCKTVNSVHQYQVKENVRKEIDERRKSWKLGAQIKSNMAINESNFQPDIRHPLEDFQVLQIRRSETRRETVSSILEFAVIAPRWPGQVFLFGGDLKFLSRAWGYSFLVFGDQIVALVPVGGFFQIPGGYPETRSKFVAFK